MKKIILILCLILINSIKSQLLTVGIRDLRVNNVNHSINTPINLGMNNSVNAIFNVTLSKSSSYSIGNARLYIRVYNAQNNTLSDLINPPIEVPTSSFQTSAMSAINVNISTNHISYGSGNYLVATLIAVDSGATWSSPQISIIKGPTFTLTPSSVSIPCNSTTPVNFTANSNSTSGSISYSWNVGNGWNYQGKPVTAPFTTSTNSINLTPTNPNTLPSSVLVTPIWNNTAQRTLRSSVTRENFINNITISGNPACNYPSMVTYDINNLPSGSVVWSSSDTTIGQIVSTNGTQANVKILKEGTFTLSAVATNSCNQQKQLTKNIRVGAPNINTTSNRTGYCNFEVRAKDSYPSENSGIIFSWSYVSGTGNASPSNLITSGDFASFYACPPFTVRLKVTASNSCGTRERFVDLWLNNDDEEIMTVHSSEIANNKRRTIDNSSPYFTVSPNPSEDYINISLIDRNKMLPINTKVQVELYNNMGQKVYNTTLDNNTSTLSVKDLVQGIYTLKIQYDNKVESHKIIKK